MDNISLFKFIIKVTKNTQLRCEDNNNKLNLPPEENPKKYIRKQYIQLHVRKPTGIVDSSLRRELLVKIVLGL